jgi:Tfp pilus assembly protein PilP
MKKKFMMLLLCGILLTLTGCEKKNTAKQDAKSYAEKIEAAAKSIPQKNLDIITDIKPVVYDGANRRDPFELPASIRNVKQYPNTILPNVALDSFKLVGILLLKDDRWAMLRANDGKVYKVSVGVRIGLQQALVTDIEKNQVKFRIDSPAETNEKPREVVMKLQEKTE